MILRKALPALFLFGAFVWIDSVPAKDEVEEGFVALFNGKDLSGFKSVLRAAKRGKKIENVDAFTVKEGAILISGKPLGYLHTEKSYKNYALRFDWKFLKDGTTGVAVHITKDSVVNQVVWPTCVVVEGGPEKVGAGRMFGLVGGGIEQLSGFHNDKKAQKEVIKKGQWNTTEITSKNGELICKINGIEVSKGKSERTEGPIGWLSEGGKLLCKNIRIKVLK